MASTRRAAPLEIYQDPVTSYHDHDVEQALFNALGPMSNNPTSKHNPRLEPSRHTANGTSPQKSDRHSSSPAGPLGKRTLNSVSLPPPRQPDFTTDSPKKNASYYAAHQVPSLPHLPHEAMYNNYLPDHITEKENMLPSQSFDQSAMPFQDSKYVYKAPMKRTVSDIGPLREKSNNKRVKTEEAQDAFVLPHPEEMPIVEDDGTKPSFSYATLIGMAILRAPYRRLTLAQIYKWISDHFKFYKTSDSGWQNSIRHNLSLNKAFIKQERPKDDPGKGNYWAIQPGMENQFLNKDRPFRKLMPGDSSFVQATPQDFGNRTTSTPAIGQFTLAPSTSKRFDSKAIDSSKFPDEPLSSDGTIPASDPALADDEQDSLAMPPPAMRQMRSSPPAEDINSSPPPMISEPVRQGTPTGLPKLPSTIRKRNAAAMNDSGYYSSIESSVTRGPVHAVVPTSDADIDRPRLKRGRAEEEIARIRSSSYDSPSKDSHRRKPSVHFETSSPKRPDSSSGLPPLTPAVVFKRPALPPASISPNTNLRNHRNRIKRLLGDSPSKNMTPLRESDHVWSSHFGGLDHEHFVSPAKSVGSTPWRDAMFNNAFDVFEYHNQDDLSARGSPEKTRPRIERAVTHTGILADITGNAFSKPHFPAPGSASASTSTVESPFNLAFSPFKMTPDSVVPRSPVQLGSPLKRPMIATPTYLMSNNNENTPAEWLDLNLESLFGMPELGKTPKLSSQCFSMGEDIFTVQPPSDASEEGFDILQEFGKIGAHVGSQRYPQQSLSQGSPVKRSTDGRPPMARSVTSRF